MTRDDDEDREWVEGFIWGLYIGATAGLVLGLVIGLAAAVGLGWR